MIIDHCHQWWWQLLIIKLRIFGFLLWKDVNGYATLFCWATKLKIQTAKIWEMTYFQSQWFSHCLHFVRCLLSFQQSYVFLPEAAWSPCVKQRVVLWLQQRASLHKENKTKRTCAQWVGKEWVVFRRRKKTLLWMFPCRAENAADGMSFYSRHRTCVERKGSVVCLPEKKRQTISPAWHSTKGSLVWHLYRVVLLFKGITY